MTVNLTKNWRMVGWFTHCVVILLVVGRIVHIYFKIIESARAIPDEIHRTLWSGPYPAKEMMVPFISTVTTIASTILILATYGH